MLAKVKKFVNKHKYKIILGLGVLAVGWWAYDCYTDESAIKLSHFIQALKGQHIKEIVVKGSTVEFRGSGPEWFHTSLGSLSRYYLYSLIQQQKELIFSEQDPSLQREVMYYVVGTAFTFISVRFMLDEMRGPAKSDMMQPQIVQNNQRFDDFYGGDKIKLKFKETIEFLREPNKYEKMGARIRRGVLFYGPPGTGKTMLARALANEAGCEFIKVVASEFQELFVGVGAKRVRELFASARKCPQGCIIFVDQIDALGSRLNHLRDSHETTSTINQFLSEMDGFSPTDRIVIVAATNRIDLVDHAVLRAGRFDIKVQVDLPCFEQRKGIFSKLVATKCRSYEIPADIINEVALQSQSWSGADLENLINESIYRAIRQKSDTVRGQHVMEAMAELLAR